MELVTSMGVMLDDDLRPIHKAMYAAAVVPGGEFLPIATLVACSLRAAPSPRCRRTTNANRF